jgi:hypothetical protein
LSTESLYNDSLKIVVSPVRVRVSPSDKAPANPRLLHAEVGHHLSGCAQEARAKSQTKSQNAKCKRAGFRSRTGERESRPLET